MPCRLLLGEVPLLLERSGLPPRFVPGHDCMPPELSFAVTGLVAARLAEVGAGDAVDDWTGGLRPGAI